MPLTRTPPLHLLRTLCEVGRRGSYREAARSLHITPSAVSHQMRDLQQRLGVTLVERSPGGTRLTPMGEHYRQACEAALTALDEATAQTQSQARRKLLRITLGPFIASEVVIPALPDFHRHHPDLDIRVETSMRLADLEADEADIALRFGGAETAALALEPLLSMSAQPVCAPSLRQGLPPGGELPLGRTTLLHSTAVPDAWSAWATQAGIDTDALGSGIWFDSYLSLLRAAEQGLGVALGLFPAVEGWLLSGRLCLAADTSLPIQPRYNMLYRRQDANWPALQAFREWLRALSAFR